MTFNYLVGTAPMTENGHVLVIYIYLNSGFDGLNVPFVNLESWLENVFVNSYCILTFNSF